MTEFIEPDARDVELAALRAECSRLKREHAALLEQIGWEVAAIDTHGIEPAASFKLRALDLIAKAS